MTLKLYSDVGSGSCRRVNAVIQHLGIEVEHIAIDLLAGDNRTEEFLALNPSAMVPVLIVTQAHAEDLVLTEASAIMIYLCENCVGQSANDLWPTDHKRYEITKWMFWAAEHFRQPAPVYFEEKIITRLTGTAENTERIKDADRLLVKFSNLLDNHLRDRDYVVGNNVTLADFDLAAALSQMSRSYIPYESFDNIMRWERHMNTHVEAWRTTGQTLNSRMDKALAHC